MNSKKLRDKNFCEELYIKQNKTAKEIGKILKCSDCCVFYWLYKHKIIIRKSGKKPLKYQNKRFGNLVTISGTYNGHSIIWLCKCDCGNTCNVSASNLKKGTKYCRLCRNKECSLRFWKGCGDIPHVHFSSIERQAKTRNLEFNITIEDMWDLFLKQDRKCALSGVDLNFVRKKKIKQSIYSTASLDRIDSSKGYTKDNVQWIHKDVNIMKNKYDQKDFIKYCKLIAEKHKE